MVCGFPETLDSSIYIDDFLREIVDSELKKYFILLDFKAFFISTSTFSPLLCISKQR
jgi:hypothetical protein